MMITIVAGLGRCGSSLLMKMLISGGIPPSGEAASPLWEDGRAATLPGRSGWLDECEGQCLKILTPHRAYPPPRGPYQWIWIDRDPAEQKKSQHKCAMWMKRKRIPFKIKAWREASLKAIEQAGGRVLMMNFEQVIEHPLLQSIRIVEFLGLDPSLVPTIAGQVRKRKTACLDGMAEGKFVPGARPTALV